MTEVSNPKDKLAASKARWFSVIPTRVLAFVGLAMVEGARKYGRHNWRATGVQASIYVDAVVCGHLMPWWEGEDVDPDSGLNHIDKAIAGLIVLRDSMLQGNWIDDRPIRTPRWKRIADLLLKKHGELIRRYPEAKESFTEQWKRNQHK